MWSGRRIEWMASLFAFVSVDQALHENWIKLLLFFKGNDKNLKLKNKERNQSFLLVKFFKINKILVFFYWFLWLIFEGTSLKKWTIYWKYSFNKSKVKYIKTCDSLSIL